MAADYTIERPGEEPVCVYNLPDSDDARLFEYSYRFFEGCQHDHLDMAWDGTTRRERERANYLRERYYPRDLVPVDPGSAAARKPDMTTPMASAIVTRSTGLLLGADPKISLLVDEDSQALLRTIYTSSGLCLPLAQGRNMAGGGGAAILIPGIMGGRPVLTVGRPSEYRVLKWSDHEPWQPERIVRQVVVTRMVRDSGSSLRRPMKFWSTTEWNATHRLEYQLVPLDWEKDREIPLSSDTPPFRHGCSRCPVTYYKNSESDGLLGATDFAGLEPRFDAIDRIGAHLYTAVGKNCDPTVWHSDEEGTRRRNPMTRRGRGVVQLLSEKGSIGAMEIAGTSLEVTHKYWRALQDDTFSLADCIRVTPETAGAYKSGEALKILWRSAEIRARWLWPPLENAIRRVLTCFFEMSQSFGVSSYEAPRPGTMILPSRVLPPARPKRPAPEPVQLAPADPKAPPMNKPRPTIAAPPDERPKPELQPHKAGAFGFIDITPGDYFPATSAEKMSDLTALQLAAGGGKILSQETAVEEAAKAVGVDTDEELRRVHEEAERALELAPQKAALTAAPIGEGESPEEEDEGDDEEEEGDEE